MTKILAPAPLAPATAKEIRREGPRLFKVFLHNDDYTTMDFVIEVLQSVFRKGAIEATALMLQIHRQQKALCGLYPYEIAETKVDKVHKLAREAGFPLRCSLEPES